MAHTESELKQLKKDNIISFVLGVQNEKPIHIETFGAILDKLSLDANEL